MSAYAAGLFGILIALGLLIFLAFRGKPKVGSSILSTGTNFPA
jgi:hypothetical protein